jgi:hypothetical protein
VGAAVGGGGPAHPINATAAMERPAKRDLIGASEREKGLALLLHPLARALRRCLAISDRLSGPVYQTRTVGLTV